MWSYFGYLLSWLTLGQYATLPHQTTLGPALSIEPPANLEPTKTIDVLQASPIVFIDDARVDGYQDSQCQYYLGIPYAVPPLVAAKQVGLQSLTSRIQHRDSTFQRSPAYEILYRCDHRNELS